MLYLHSKKTSRHVRMKPIRKILVIRFRQIGDSILAIALCSTLKRSFPTAEVHFVVNKNIAPLYEGHPDIDKIFTFDKNENKPFHVYIKKYCCPIKLFEAKQN